MGQLGFGTTGGSIDTPQHISSISGVSEVDAGGEFSLARKSDGTAWAWGSNLTGQCGIGANNWSNTPVSVSVCQLSNGIPHFEKQISFSVFPNPSGGLFSINLRDVSPDQTISIYDHMGKCILSKKYNEQKSIIDLEKEPKGIYFVRIGSVSKKIIKE